jgi:hypothetical protein
MHCAKTKLLIAAGVLALPSLLAQPKSAKASAPIDLTGYWVSVVTEDWRWRMITPAKGDYASIPITPGAKKLADTWDPAKDEAAGEQCRSYGAPAIMRVPGRFHITWQDDNTLKVESDYGMQTRLFHFGSWTAPGGPAGWQGDSVARWEIPRNRAGTGSVAREVETQGGFGSLAVETTHIRPGYLRKNGVPYGAKAKLTEFWDLNRETNGDQWLVITTLVDDPEFLQEQWVTALHFKKEADGAKWDPTPCSSKW